MQIKIILILLVCWFSNQSFAIIDSEQPIKIQADNALLDQTSGTATYNGNVIIEQGSRHLSADTLVIKRNANNKIECMVATGQPARFHSQENPEKPKGFGKAKTIKYYPEKSIIDLLDEAELTKDGDTVSGPILSYNFSNGNLKTSSNGKKRATFILQPRRDD